MAKNPLEDLLFAIAFHIDSEQAVVVFCPKEYWAQEHHAYDNHLGNRYEPKLGDRFHNLEESMYSFDGTVAEARALLAQLGVTHSQEFEDFLCDHDCNPATDDMDMEEPWRRERRLLDEASSGGC